MPQLVVKFFIRFRFFFLHITIKSIFVKIIINNNNMLSCPACLQEYNAHYKMESHLQHYHKFTTQKMAEYFVKVEVLERIRHLEANEAELLERIRHLEANEAELLERIRQLEATNANQAAEITELRTSNTHIIRQFELEKYEASNTCIPLSNGDNVPIIGFATWQSNERDVANDLRIALDNGTRLIDTAWANTNELVIGQVLQELFDSGKLKREDIFVTKNLFWCFNCEQEVEPQIRTSLANLQLEKVDLYLVHMPRAQQYDLSGPDDQRLMSVWRQMENIHKLGLARSIGVSNANAEQLERVQNNVRVPIDDQLERKLYFLESFVEDPKAEREEKN